MECLKKYVEKHNKENPKNQIDFAFVKDEDIEDELGNTSYKLYYTKTKWTENLDDTIWKSLKDLFEEK